MRLDDSVGVPASELELRRLRAALAASEHDRLALDHQFSHGHGTGQGSMRTP